MSGFASANLTTAAAAAQAAAAGRTFAQAVDKFGAGADWTRERAASFLRWIARYADESHPTDYYGPDWLTAARLLTDGEPANDPKWRTQKLGPATAARLISDGYFDDVAKALDDAGVSVPPGGAWLLDADDWRAVRQAIADRLASDPGGRLPPTPMPTPTPAPAPKPKPAPSPVPSPGTFPPIPPLPGPVPPIPPAATSSATSSSSTSGIAVLALLALLAVAVGRRL